MKNFSKITFLVFSVLIVAGCSSSKPKDTHFSDQVIDSGMIVEEPLKVKESGVYDAGIYRDGEDYNDLMAHGGKNGAVIPAEKFYSVDREKNVPLNKLLYVLTDDHPAHCMKGKYIMLGGRKKLVVYSKSTVPSNYCIYQKSYSSEAEGFSLYINDGGICRPSFTDIKIDDQKRKLASVEQVANTISMSYCTQDTFSYGEELVRRKH